MQPGFLFHICDMLSISCKYAIRATVYLMSRSKQLAKAGLKEVAEEIEANEHTTGKILQLLVKSKIITSLKGPGGGFFVAAINHPVYLIDIVNVIDGDHFFFECGLGLKKCSEAKPCPIHHTYKISREKLYQEFCSVTIQELADDLTMGKAFLKR